MMDLLSRVVLVLLAGIGAASISGEISHAGHSYAAVVVWIVALLLVMYANPLVIPERR